MKMKTLTGICPGLVAMVLAAVVWWTPGRAHSCTYAPTTDLTTALQLFMDMYADEGVGMCVWAMTPTQKHRICRGYQNRMFGVYADNNTLFQIGSITKVMTGLLLGRRYGEGSIILSERADHYLPPILQVCPTHAGSPACSIRVLDLITHHSGIPKDSNFGLSINMELGLLALNTESWATTPTLGFYNYSNEPIRALGDIMAYRDGYASWADDNFSNVMVPLGMPYTLTDDQFTSYGPAYSSYFYQHVASTYDSSGAFVDVGFPNTDYKASGQLYSTMEDMATFMKFIMGRTSAPSQLATAWREARYAHDDRAPTDGTTGGSAASTDPDDKIGLAWNIDTQQSCFYGDHASRYWKGGSTTNSAGYIGYVLNESSASYPLNIAERGVILLMNSNELTGLTHPTYSHDELGEMLLEWIANVP